MKAMVDFGNIWFILSTAFPILVLIIVFLWAKFGINSRNSDEKVMLTIILLLPVIGDASFFITSLRKSPIFDFGFWISIFTPVVVFYISLLLSLISFIKILLRGLYNSNGAAQIKQLGIYISFMKLSAGFAYSSPTCIIPAIVSLILSIILICIWPKMKKAKNE